MHHFESNGFQFNYNGDYSGEIYIIDDQDVETVHDFAQLATLAPFYAVSNKDLAIRDFVAEAIRMASISELEQAETDELLTLSSSEIYTLVRK